MGCVGWKIPNPQPNPYLMGYNISTQLNPYFVGRVEPRPTGSWVDPTGWTTLVILTTWSIKRQFTLLKWTTSRILTKI